jgi:hypothetical protein
MKNSSRIYNYGTAQRFSKRSMKKLPDNQIAFYQSPDGAVNIEVLYAGENIWFTQKKMAELFDTTPQNITQHLKNIYAEREIDQAATCKDFLQVQDEGGRAIERNTKLYSQDKNYISDFDREVKKLARGRKSDNGKKKKL